MVVSRSNYPQRVLQIAKLLLDHGADSNIKNREGLTVLDSVQQKGNQEIIKLLKEAIAKWQKSKTG